MTSFQFEIDPKEHFVARAISHARDVLRQAFLDEKARRDFTQADLARMLGVDRSVVNRQLMGDANLTVRSLAELAWGLERDLIVQMPRADQNIGQSNEPTMVITKVSSGTTAPVGSAATVVHKVSVGNVG